LLASSGGQFQLVAAPNFETLIINATAFNQVNKVKTLTNTFYLFKICQQHRMILQSVHHTIRILKIYNMIQPSTIKQYGRIRSFEALADSPFNGEYSHMQLT